MKAVLISIRPKWCQKIISGEKTIEVRKTRPKINPPFRCYIYCSKAKERLVGILRDGDENYGEIYHGKTVFIKTGEGSVCDAWGKRQKVIGEFVCDDIFERIVQVGTSCETPKYCLCDWNMDCTPLDRILSDACLTLDELEKYLDGGVGYGWHISNLKIYDTPRELSEFWRGCPEYSELSTNCWICENVCGDGDETDCNTNGRLYLRRPPQSWCYVEEQTWKD